MENILFVFLIPYYLLCAALWVGAAVLAWAVFGWWAVAVPVVSITYGVISGICQYQAPTTDDVERIGGKWGDKDWLRRMNNN